MSVLEFMEFLDKEKLAQSLKSQKGIIGIHGDKRSGKSTLGEFLAEKLTSSLVSTDLFVSEEKINSSDGAYPNCIDYQLLLDAVKMKCEDFKVVIIEGICLIQIFEKLDIEPDVLIYSKRIYGKDEEEEDMVNIDLNESQYQKVIEKIDEILNCIKLSTCIEKDNAIYHYQYKPLAKSDYIYTWQS